MKNQKILLVKSKKKGGEIMKKGLILTAALVLFALPAMAAIKDTKHNLSNWGTGTYKAVTETQICVFCHTPHNPTQRIPLWNRTNPSGATFSVYSGSSTLNIAAADLVGLSSSSISLFCLSCHDGTTGLGAIANPGAITMNVNALGNSKSAVGKISSGALRNDHPVNFSYGTARTNEGGTNSYLADPTTFPSTVRLFANQGKAGTADYLECASCHRVHGEGGFAKLLARSNGSSNLCRTCHTK